MATASGRPHVRPEAEHAWQQLSEALLTVTPACAGNDLYTQDTVSNGEKADMAATCSSCLVLAECRTYAALDKPIGGHWPDRTLKITEVKHAA